MSTDDRPERPRYARVLSPGDDSSHTDLQLTLVLRVMFFAIFLIETITGASDFWKAVAGAATIIWVFLVVDAIRRLRAR